MHAVPTWSSPDFTWEDPVDGVRWIAFDVETTGLELQRGHRIRQVALLDDFGGTLVTDVLPDSPRARNVALAHGVSTNAPPFPAIASEVASWLCRGVIVGHNVIFDLEFLAAEFSRCGISTGPVWFVDTLTIARLLGRGGRLSEVAKRFAVSCEPNRCHEARYDASLARRILETLLESGEFSTLGDLKAQRYANFEGGCT